MTDRELADVYRAYIACLNAQDWDALGRFVGEEARHNGRRLGVEGYRAMLEQDFSEIPDLHFHVERLVAQAPWVAGRLRFDCTPKGRFLGLQVDGRRVVFAENVFYEFRDGKIVEVWSVIDKAAIEAQLGAKESASAGPIALRQLTRTELEALRADREAFAPGGRVHPGALPPAFVVSRAAARVAAGEPERWWSPFLIVEMPQGDVVGGCAFKGAPGRAGRVEVLYGISKACRGRGRAAAALGALASIAFAQGAAEVLAEIEPRNAASVRVVRRCGFERVGQRVADDGVVVEQWLLRSKQPPLSTGSIP